MGSNVAVALFFVITMVLFSFAGYKKHHAAFLDYRVKFFIQATGTLILISVGIYVNFLIRDFENPFESLKYLYLNLIQTLGILIFVISKRPQDTFMCFNKRPDI